MEQEIYSRDVFLERNQALAAEREGLQKELAALEAEAEELAAINQEQIRAGYGPQLQQVLTAYHRCANAQEQNELLKSVLAKVTYHKTSPQPARKRFCHHHPAAPPFRIAAITKKTGPNWPVFLHSLIQPPPPQPRLS